MDAFLYVNRLVSLLVTCKGRFVARSRSERQRINRVLRVLLNINCGVAPVNEICRVIARKNHRSFPEWRVPMFLFCPVASLSIVHQLLCCLQVHPVRVDNPWFLFQVERVWFREDFFCAEFLLIDRGGVRRVRVSDESVEAAGLLAVQVVPSRDLLNYKT